ncbi:hypothetical protein PALB_34960 [Pseudoalteromonas luteoviolacea B = ATCC 29581]|nr:hypothetical protein PALB_34960 [Pseudoalteromonas luteoviolacea B = ATCC 29581]
MQKTTLLSGISLLFIGFSAGASTCNAQQLEGSWSLDYAKYTNKQGQLVGEIKGGSTLSRKLLIDGVVHFITWQPNGEVTVSASGQYRVERGRYIETVEVSTYAGIKGKVFDFQCRIENGTWIHFGPENDLFIEEHWIKISK